MQHGVLNWHVVLLIAALIFGCLAIPPIPAKFNLLAASWVCYLLALFFT
jgi:hypothetical protein